MKPTDFSVAVTRFLGSYLPGQRNVCANTVKAYRDTFTLILRYCRDETGLAPERITLDHVDVDFVLGFVRHLRTARNSSAQTANHRLAAIRSFFRYVQVEHPERILECQRIMAIPAQRCQRPSVNYLSVDALKAILAQPDLSTSEGRRDAVLLSLLYDSAARVQELIGLSVGDVRLDAPAQVSFAGKGRKNRVVPLMAATVDLLAEYKNEHQLHRAERIAGPLFWNRRGDRLSRSGVRYVIDKHVEGARQASNELPERVTAHTFRHTKAMHLLQAGNPLTTVQAILGHADLRTSQIYAQADLRMKRQALEKAAITPVVLEPRSWQNDKGLMDWLRSL